MIATFRHEMFFADSLGRKKHRFLKQHYKQMMPAQLQSHSTACGFYAIFAAFHLCKVCQEEITGIQHLKVFCFICNYM